MSWASRRKAAYATGVILFVVLLISVPLAFWYFTIPSTCSDGIQNQGETAPDKGGPCLLMDERALQPYAILWSRAFRVRDGSYSAVVAIENPNKNAGVRAVPYRFGLYGPDNVLIAERRGTTFIMPSAITPVLESRISTGNRIVTRTYFEFTEPLVWERLKNTALAVVISNTQITNTDTVPRLTAQAENKSVADIIGPLFVAVLFDSAGNAFAASETVLDRLPAGASLPLVFTWPSPFAQQIGRIDIIPVTAPLPDTSARTP